MPGLRSTAQRRGAEAARGARLGDRRLLECRAAARVRVARCPAAGVGRKEGVGRHSP